MPKRTILDDAHAVLYSDSHPLDAPPRLARFARKAKREIDAAIERATDPHTRAALTLVRNRLGLE